MSFARVALPLPLHGTYTYVIPDALLATAVPGARVRVRVRQRVVVGVVTAVDIETHIADPLPILEAPDAAPVLSAELLRLAAWIARYVSRFKATRLMTTPASTIDKGTA